MGPGTPSTDQDAGACRCAQPRRTRECWNRRKQHPGSGIPGRHGTGELSHDAGHRTGPRISGRLEQSGVLSRSSEIAEAFSYPYLQRNCRLDLVRGAVLACHEVRRYRILPGNQGSHVNVRELAVLDENSAIDHVETYLLGVAHDRCREGVVQSAGELESVEVPHDQIGRLPYLDTADV